MIRMQNELIQQPEQYPQQVNGIPYCIENQGVDISKANEDQSKNIEQLNLQIKSPIKKLNFIQEKLGKLLQTHDMGQIFAILLLLLMFIVIVFLMIYT